MNSRICARLLFSLGLLSAVVVGAPRSALAEWKPTRDVEFVVPYGLGGGADLLARTITKIMQEERLVPVNISIVNKPGGGAAAGVSFVAATKHADPHTLVLFNPQTQITPLRVANARGWRDLTPVANLILDDYLVFAKTSAPYRTVADVVAAAKSKGPKSITIGSSGTADDMSIALLEQATGMKLNVVRFNSGGEVLTALLGGHVELASGNPLEFMGQLKAGEVKGIGVFRDQRFPELPDVPTLAEQGITVTPFQMWRGVALPKDVPAEAREYWTGVMSRVFNSEAYKNYVKSNYATLDYKDGATFQQFLEAQEKIYAEMLKQVSSN